MSAPTLTMRSQLRQLACVTALGLALSVPATAGRADDETSLLELLELHASERVDIRQAATMRLLAIEPDRLEEVMDILMRRTVPASGPLGHPSEQVLLRRMTTWPASDVTQAIMNEVQLGDLAQSVRALELFAGAGSARSIGKTIDLVNALDPVHQQQPLVRDAFTAALGGILERDEHAVAKLATEVRGVDATWLPEIVAALGQTGGEPAFRLLEGLMGLDDQLDQRILSVLAEWPRWEASATNCARLIENYLGSAVPEIRRSAALALGRVGDAGSLPALVRALNDEDGRTRHASGWALEQLSGMSGGSNVNQWSQWLESEEHWLENRGAELIDALPSAQSTAALRTLQELGNHSWFAEPIVEATVPQLRNEDEVVATMACQVLLECGTSEAFDALVDALADARQPVREAAWRALCTLTGKRLAPEIGAWTELQG